MADYPLIEVYPIQGPEFQKCIDDAYKVDRQPIGVGDVPTVRIIRDGTTCEQIARHKASMPSATNPRSYDKGDATGN